MTLNGIVSISLADVKRRGRTKVVPLLGAVGEAKRLLIVVSAASKLK